MITSPPSSSAHIRFAHFSDVHIGSWKEPKLADASTEAFVRACDLCIKENVDFILLAGDLFNTSLPAIDRLRIVVGKLRELREREIPVYLIAGSHDFSPSGKTMLDVLEEAGLARNVVRGTVDRETGRLFLRFTVDPKTGVKIAGMIGKKGMLERAYYEGLDLASLEAEPGYKIFMFHTAIEELKPKELDMMDASPISMLPRGFDYYAGGHVHIIKEFSMDGYRKVVYPGALFPANFREIEQWGCGGLFIVEHTGGREDLYTYRPIEIYPVVRMQIDCHHRSAADTRKLIKEEIGRCVPSLPGAIVTLRVVGTIREGRISDIDLAGLAQEMEALGAYVVLRNTAKLLSAEFAEIAVQKGSVDETEDLLIGEHAGQMPLDGLSIDAEKTLVKTLLSALDSPRAEGEKVSEFEERIVTEASRVIEAQRLI